MDRVGRKRILVGSVMCAAMSLIAFAYVAAAANVDSSSISRQWIVAAACCFQCFTISAWNSIDVLTSELFPTSVRSTGMGMCAATGRVGAMLAQIVNGALIARPVRLLLVAALTLLLGACTPAFLPADKTGQPISDRMDESVGHERLNRANQDHLYVYQRVAEAEQQQHRTLPNTTRNVH
jgi:MFS family permease